MTRRFLEEHSSVSAAHCLRIGPLYLPTTVRQLLFYIVLLLGLTVFFYWDKKIWFTVLTFALCGAYAVVILFRLASVALALFFRMLGKPYEHQPKPEQLAGLRPEDLPVYTILVPMYKEPEVAHKVAHAVTSLDYPIDKLDVKLLLEEDDPETRGKVEEVIDQLPRCVEVIVCPRVPKGEPRTKPRACNWGLDRANGEFLVIYDAEDQPEGDQLKKAVYTFRELDRKGGHGVACLQAKLNYFNARHNWLTKFFTLEYTTWFDLFLPGLHAFRTPIPLGGTSNHFRTAVLKDLGGWDPFNVTEDCDLGERLARRRYKTHVLDSTTWEEANSAVGNWVRQRSRWVKGYFQTHLVHTRDSILPFLLLAVGLMVLKSFIDHDVVTKQHVPVVQLVGPVASMVCLVLAIASGALFLWAVLERQRARKGGYTEGRFSLYDAFTFRITVGGLSGMLLLNVPFWILSAAYLFHPQVADIMDAVQDVPVIEWVTEYNVDEEGTPLREAVRTWKLQHEEVTNDSFTGATIWNVTGQLITGQLGFEDARKAYGAIDQWSLASQILYPVVIALFLANFVFILLNIIACGVRRMWDLLAQAVLAPFYWVLISVGAFKGAWQLCWNPFFWEKTIHGLTPSQAGTRQTISSPPPSVPPLPSPPTPSVQPESAPASPGADALPPAPETFGEHPPLSETTEPPPPLSEAETPLPSPAVTAPTDDSPSSSSSDEPAGGASIGETAEGTEPSQETPTPTPAPEDTPAAESDSESASDSDEERDGPNTGPAADPGGPNPPSTLS